MKLRPLLVNGALVLGSVAFVLLLLEAALRFMPVNEGFNFLAVDAGQPVFRAAPDQDIVWSKDWNFAGARRLHVNNAGFRNDQDYVDDPARPLIAVVGDSYVEAVQVAYEETLFGRLQESLGERARVYSFGFSGAPASQYLVWARHARDRFANDYLAVIVVDSDYGENLLSQKRGPGFHHYAPCGAGDYCLTRVDFQRGRLASLLKSSALVRYLVYNLRGLILLDQAQAAIGGLFRPAPAGPASDAAPAPAPAPGAPADRRLADSRLGMDLFLRDIAAYAGLPPGRILFVVDGRPYDRSDAAFDGDYFGQMRRHFIDGARAGGFAVIDMRPVFAAHYKAHGERFEDPGDDHWNALGHALVARELAAYYRPLLE